MSKLSAKSRKELEEAIYRANHELRNSHCVSNVWIEHHILNRLLVAARKQLKMEKGKVGK